MNGQQLEIPTSTWNKVNKFKWKASYFPTSTPEWFNEEAKEGN